jgi:hypothetical protein
MEATRFNRAQDFIWRNARIIDRHLFAHLFLDGPKQPFFTALQAYQNADGGFGHAIEPDIRTPLSVPQGAEVALRLMDMIGEIDQGMVDQLCGYLETITTPEGGVPFTLPTANPYPHAPWWNSEQNPPASVNPTAAIGGLLHKYGVQHPWLERASAFCWKAIEASESAEFHDLIPVITFLEHTPERERAERELQRIGARILASNSVTFDPNTEGYIHTPLDWAPTPESFCRSLFSDDVLLGDLQARAAAQQEDGGWPILWPPISPGCELEWRGHVTIGVLLKLRAYEKVGLRVEGSF